MVVPLFDGQREFEAHADELLAAAERVLRSGNWILGPEVDRFEGEIAQFLTVRHAVGVASGSDALILALKALDIGPGDAVVTTPYSFFATAGAIANVGALPVFADVEPITLNLDPSRVRQVLERRSRVHQRLSIDIRAIRCIVPVHLFGLPADVSAFLGIKRDFGIPVVEDAAQAFGSTIGGRPVGSLGDVGCFSLFPTKNLGGFGDGGVAVTNSDVIAEALRRLRSHGAREKYVHETVGLNSRLDALQASMLRVRLGHIEDALSGRGKHAMAYDSALRDTEGISIPPSKPGRTYHQYVIRSALRDELKSDLARSRIDTAIHYPIPLHLSDAFARLGYRSGDFPVAEEASRSALSLPIFPTMRDDERSIVVVAVLDALRARSERVAPAR
jgi:dTDP-4-amino-4,6-dideoxygalactose transaminase